jgi:hypothetical protein
MRIHRQALVVSLGFLVLATACTGGRRTDIPDAMFSDAGTFDSGGGTCGTDLVDCSGTCARLAADSNNCGTCGNVCPTGTSCAVGRCDCLAPMLACDGICIDPMEDAEHCGTCTNACGATESCSAGECIVSCTASHHGVCVNTDAEGMRTQICADFNHDSMNCGACNTVCTAGSTCTNGTCQCPGGGTACSGMCVDTNTDPTNCGSCLSSCGDGGTCSGGVCASCGPGLDLCGSPHRCVNTSTSRLHCGACGHACEGGQACVDGTCECLGTLVDCGTGCVDLTSDVSYCGDCETDCGAGGACADGICTCAPGFDMCGLECANLMTDSDHCMTCDVACGPMEACILGACVIAPLYHGWASPLAGCLTTGWDTTAPTPLGGTYPYNAGDSAACRAWKLAATVCTTMPTDYGATFSLPNENWTCPESGGFTDPVFGTYCASPFEQYACSTCPAACNAGTCFFGPVSLRDCSGAETAVR